MTRRSYLPFGPSTIRCAHPEAADFFEKLADRYPGDSRIRSYWANALFHDAQFGRAREVFAQARTLAETDADRHQAEQALEILDRILEKK